MLTQSEARSSPNLEDAFRSANGSLDLLPRCQLEEDPIDVNRAVRVRLGALRGLPLKVLGIIMTRTTVLFGVRVRRA